jgi:hypothetical protein
MVEYLDHQSIGNLIKLLGILSYATQIYIGTRQSINQIYKGIPDSSIQNKAEHKKM